MSFILSPRDIIRSIATLADLTVPLKDKEYADALQSIPPSDDEWCSDSSRDDSEDDMEDLGKSSAGEEENLPYAWTECISSNGRKYYWNAGLEQSSWHPGSKEKVRLVEKYVPDMIFIFPNPGHTSDAAEKKFQQMVTDRMRRHNKKHINGKIHSTEEYCKKELPKSFIHEFKYDKPLETVLTSCTLAGMRYCAIDIVRSLCKSLNSLKAVVRSDDASGSAVDQEANDTLQSYMKARCRISFLSSLNRGGVGSERNKHRLLMCVRMNESLTELLADMEDYPLQISDEAVRAADKLNIKLPVTKYLAQTLPIYLQGKALLTQGRKARYKLNVKSHVPATDIRRIGRKATKSLTYSSHENVEVFSQSRKAWVPAIILGKHNVSNLWKSIKPYLLCCCGCHFRRKDELRKVDSWSVHAYIKYDARWRRLLRVYPRPGVKSHDGPVENDSIRTSTALHIRETLESTRIDGTTSVQSSTSCRTLGKTNALSDLESIRGSKEIKPRHHCYTILRHIDRMRLIATKMCQYINFEELMKCNLMDSWFFAHDPPRLADLRRDWGSFKQVFSMSQPIDDIRNYFGEKVAFYFLFAMFLTRCFMMLFIVASIADAAYYLNLHGDNMHKYLSAAIVVIWCLVIRRLWPRLEDYWANRWGTDKQFDASINLQNRQSPYLRGKKQPSQLDQNETEIVAHPGRALFGRVVADSVSFIYLCFVLCVVFIGLWLRSTFSSKTYVGLAMTIQIKIIDILWDKISFRLVQLEEHVEMLDFYRSRASRLFIMKCVNAFASFFWIAYAQPYLYPETCGADGARSCPELLSSSLTSVFCIYIGFGILGLPYSYFQSLENAVLAYRGWRDGFNPSRIEREAALPDYSDDELVSDFTEIVFPVALVAWFGMTHLWFLTLLALLSNVVQLRFDALKLCHTFRRPFPSWVSNLGLWRNVFDFSCWLSIFFNVGLLQTQVEDPVIFFRLFAPETITKLETVGLKWVGQALVACVILVALLVLDRALSQIPKVSYWTDLQRRRQSFQRSRLFTADVFSYNEEEAITLEARETETCEYIQRVACDHVTPKRLTTSFYFK